ncbi:ATP-binding protein [Argonema antarcticum]|uniref:ATP-binding protein n=1 Tax=Argonema antarcticum TaxID=2942763 RepID=UPI00201246E6|nr:ATP-binding protein [Argonema antarcticum]MCL1471119.1 Hpt domain-containing protein [Argonema antarcticum A004/B2]
MQPDDQREFIKEFVENAKDHLYIIEQGLLNLQVAKDPESVNQILRAVESLKLGAEMLGIKSIERTAHRLRKLLEIVRDYPIQFDQSLASLFIQIFDALDLLVNELESIFGLNENFSSQVVSDIESVFQSLQDKLNMPINPRVPFAEIEQIFPLYSAVQNAATEYGKQAEVKIEEQEILISTSVLKHLPKLLTHLINNAIAHGIELPEVRQAAGKSPVGQIKIRVFSQGNQTAIAFSDDGAGIDIERVKTKAIEKGLITSSQAQTISTAELYELLYHPDFTTKDKRDLRAGLGFGMDIIRTELNKKGGGDYY